MSGSDLPHARPFTGSSDAMPTQSERPNVVFIVLDDVGFADLGCYGSEIETRNLDRLAESGLRYTNFHTTAMCSPTRASLLSGRQHHAVGMGIIAEWATSQPGYTGRINRGAATIAEILQATGYGTMAVGKWHLMPQTDANISGPFTDWPLQKGFDRWYGFHGALTDSWHPELFEDNHAVDLAESEDYHLSVDLVDHSISYLRDFKGSGAGRPFFLYLAFGAAHWPHHVPDEFVAKYAGRYDRGWDHIREARFARQKHLNIIPSGTALAPRNEGVLSWNDLDADRQRLFARMQEVYAGFIDHTDVQIGRLIQYLETVGELDNTIIVVVSDNGASAEGGPDGTINARKQLYYRGEDFAETLAGIDDLGSDRSCNHYPLGWAQVSNTPLKWYKKDVHGGGVRDPFIVHWPAGIADGGGTRTQYHHVVDVMPTIMELLDGEFPKVVRGEPQMPVQGTSMAYTIGDPEIPTRKKVQYYELLGDRGIWRDGWKAVTLHRKGTPFADDRWELYNLAEDFSECHDLADEHPELLDELIALWWQEAQEHNVLPLDDRESERAAEALASRSKGVYRFYGGMSRLDRFHVPDFTNKSFVISAAVDVPGDVQAQGVLLSVGTRYGGFVFYVQNDASLTFEYSYDGRERTFVTSESTVPTGQSSLLQMRFTSDGEGGGHAELLINGSVDGSCHISRTWPAAGLSGGQHCGRDGASPVSEAYELPFAFSGQLHHVTVELDQSGMPDAALEARRALIEE